MLQLVLLLPRLRLRQRRLLLRRLLLLQLLLLLLLLLLPLRLLIPGGWGLSQPGNRFVSFVRASGRGDAKLRGRARGDAAV